MTVGFLNDTFVDQDAGNPIPKAQSIRFSLPPTVGFWILLVFEIPSLACSLILLYYLFFDRTLRQALHNHVITVLLFVGLFPKLMDIPAYLTFLRLGYVWPQTPINCYLWWFARTCIHSMVGILVAWASIERHILIFHHQWMATQKNRFFIHYVPMVTLVLYCLVLYTVIIYFPTCNNALDYTQNACGKPCFYYQTNVSAIDLTVNTILPTLLIAIFNILLLIRIVKQKRRLRQRMQWHKYRRMTIQLVSCSALFLLFNLPLMCLLVAHLLGLPQNVAAQAQLYTSFTKYFITLLMPFVFLGSLPEIWRKMKRIMGGQHSAVAVAPATITMRPMIMRQTML